jgi:hypothetical protein
MEKEIKPPHWGGKQVCQIFMVQHTKTGKNIPSDNKISQIATKWTENLPNGHKIYQHLPLQDTPKFTQIRIFGLKINHLATLGWKTFF